MDQFFELETERPVGMTALPIPVSRMEDRLDRIGVSDPDDRDWYLRLWRAMDGHHLKLIRDKTKGGEITAPDEGHGTD